MRVLFAGVPGHGHVLPMLALVDAFRAVGDQVTIATGPDLCRYLQDRGYRTVAAGASGEQLRDFVRLNRPPHLPPNQGMAFAWGELFTRFHAPLMLADLLAVIDGWKPDLLIHESAEFATPLAGTLRGLPWVNHGYGVMRPVEIQRVATEAMRALWQDEGLSMPIAAGMFDHAYVDVCPPSLQLDQRLPPTRMPMRPTHVRAQRSPSHERGHLHVLVTFGTVFHRDAALVGEVVRTVARLPVTVLVTSGPGVAPEALGPQPQNVRVIEYAPLADLLPQCAAVVCHGGSGTILAALAHGKPLVVLPQGADQFLNAQQVLASGSGLTSAGTAAVEEALAHLLDEPTYRSRAEQIAVEIAAMPMATEVAEQLRTLATTRR